MPQYESSNERMVEVGNENDLSYEQVDMLFDKLDEFNRLLGDVELATTDSSKAIFGNLNEMHIDEGDANHAAEQCATLVEHILKTYPIGAIEKLESELSENVARNLMSGGEPGFEEAKLANIQAFLDYARESM